MKKFSIAVVLLLSVFTFANAQNSPQGSPGGRNMGTPEERAQRQTEMVSTRLNLTADQKAQVQVIFLAQAKSVDSLRKASAGDMAAMRSSMKSIQQANESKLITVLNDEQKKQYAAYQEERKNRMQQGADQPKKKKEKEKES